MIAHNKSKWQSGRRDAINRVSTHSPKKTRNKKPTTQNHL